MTQIGKESSPVGIDEAVTPEYFEAIVAGMASQVGTKLEIEKSRATHPELEGTLYYWDSRNQCPLLR